jgi:hypothetical protein
MLGRRASGAAALLIAVGAAAQPGCESDPAHTARVVAPVYGDPCRFAQCSASSACAVDPQGAPVCLCNVGYTGTRCDTCEPGFHLDFADRCLPDKSCLEQEVDPCGPHGLCDDSQLVITCGCAPGYEGPRCNLCQPGFGHDEFADCLQLTLGVHPLQPPIAPEPPDAATPPSTAGCGPEDCAGDGRCDASSGAIVCACHEGYAGARCTDCAEGYRRDATDACVAAQSCTPTRCSARGTCDDSSGLAICSCEAGFDGDGCEQCAAGFHADGAGGCVLDEQCIETTCGGHGNCTATAGVTACTCDPAYAPPNCDRCASGHHRDRDELCVADEVCSPGDCSGHGACDASTGTIRCTCDEGYWGEACELCAPGLYHRHPVTQACVEIACSDRPAPAVTFEGLIGFPTSPDTCQTGVAFNTVALTMTSRAGDGALWACGPSSVYELATKHVMLEVGVDEPAQLIFGDSISELAFDYVGLGALSLEVRADGIPIAQDISAPRRAAGQAVYIFDRPVTVIEIRNRMAGTVLLALDDIYYDYVTCDG